MVEGIVVIVVGVVADTVATGLILEWAPVKVLAGIVAPAVAADGAARIPVAWGVDEVDLVEVVDEVVKEHHVVGGGAAEDNAHLHVYKKFNNQLQNEITRTSELKKILNESNKILAFEEVLRDAKLRLPHKLDYHSIKLFRKDSAQRNLNKWLTKLYKSVQEENEPPLFDESIILEIEELTKVLQDEIKMDSLAATATLTACASYLAALHPAAILAVVSSLISYIPLTNILTRLYRKTGPNNFIFYFVDWRKPPIKVR